MSGTKSERKMVKRALQNRARKDMAMVNEIKGFPFKIRVKIAWAILKGDRK
jgi:hypothetical protein